MTADTLLDHALTLRHKCRIPNDLSSKSLEEQNKEENKRSQGSPASRLVNRVLGETLCRGRSPCLWVKNDAVRVLRGAQRPWGSGSSPVGDY